MLILILTERVLKLGNTGGVITQLENELDGPARTPAVTVQSLSSLNLLYYTPLPNKQFGHIVIDLISKIYLHGFGQKEEGSHSACSREKEPVCGAQVEFC